MRLLSNFLSPSLDIDMRRALLLRIPSYPTLRITHISLRNTGMDYMNIIDLSNIRISSLVTLDLTGNDIDAKGAKALAESGKVVQGIYSRFYELLLATWLANYNTTSRLSTDATKELFLQLAQHGVTSSEIDLLLDDRYKYPLLIDLLEIRGLLERKILERFYERNIGNIHTNFGVNFYVFQKIIGKLDTKTLGNFTKAILGDVCVKKLNLNDSRALLQNYTVERIKGNTVIEDSESIALDFLDLKEFLESNTAPHETKYEEKRKNKKLSEEPLSDIYHLYEKDSDTQPILEKVSLVASECSEQVNNAQDKSKLPIIVPPALAIAGIVSGLAIAVYLEMLVVGIAVGACCLVAAAIVYCHSRPSSFLENSNVQEKIARGIT